MNADKHFRLSSGELSLSVVIPTYGRERVLVDTINHLLSQTIGDARFLEIILIDQTENHLPETTASLGAFSASGKIRWLRESTPNLTRAMNRGLIDARGDLVLFVDDDIVPDPNLLKWHLNAHFEHPEVSVVVGQILQPGEIAEDLNYVPRGGNLLRYLDFPFRRTRGAYIENAMAGNMSVVRSRALAIGGFDENFPPPVAARFETEFAKRIVSNSGRIWFEPNASIRHLRAPSGGTRSLGSHLTSAKPIYGVGDYYFAMRCGRGLERFLYVVRKPFREIRTKFHLRNPWWIPVKLLGEVRAFALALKLHSRGASLLSMDTDARIKPYARVNSATSTLN
jgi:glycosyltransferase involved in cell wall biosynthesis